MARSGPDGMELHGGSGTRSLRRIILLVVVLLATRNCIRRYITHALYLLCPDKGKLDRRLVNYVLVAPPRGERIEPILAQHAFHLCACTTS